MTTLDSSRIKVLIASNHGLLGEAIRALLEAEPSLEVVGQAADLEEAVALTRRLRPDVAVLACDPQQPPSMLLRMYTAWLRFRVIVVAHNDDPGLARYAMDLGAAGYLGSTAGVPDLIAAIRRAYSGPPAVDPRPVAMQAHASAPGPRPPLSRRETQVLELLVRGHTSREISTALGVGPKSVETYRKRLMDKLGVSTRADLVAYAIEAGLLPSPNDQLR